MSPTPGSTRIIETSPIPPVFVPKNGTRKAMAYLYPDEDRALLRCSEIPLPRRLFYGFGPREGMRMSEAVGLTWADVDLERGAVRLDVNKTKNPRTWALDPGVVRALTAWRAMQGEPADDALIFDGANMESTHAVRASAPSWRPRASTGPSSTSRATRVSRSGSTTSARRSSR